MSAGLVLGFDRDREPAGAFAARLGRDLHIVECHRFPDGELRLRLPQPMPPRVIVYAPLDRPNEKLVELLLLARAAREEGVTELALVAPYLCYMRQDMAFRPGEIVSQRIVGRFLADLFDDVVTVDPHLHRVHLLAQAVPAHRAIALSAAPLLGEYVASRVPAARRGATLLVGPDAESKAWVEAAARVAGMPSAVCLKTRHGDADVEIALPAADFAGRDVVLIDDVASTGRTLATAAAALRAAGAAAVDAAVTHALFVDGAQRVLHDSGIREIWSADSIVHPTNRVRLAPLLAEAFAR